MKYTNCRSCALNYSLTYKDGPHIIVNKKIKCIICGITGQNVSHSNNEDLEGDALECNNCHNYILYYDKENNLWKDEIYLPEDYLLMRTYEDNESWFAINDKSIATFPYIVQFTNPKELFDKLKKLVIFL
jgi:hypothetical protein